MVTGNGLFLNGRKVYGMEAVKILATEISNRYYAEVESVEAI